jgi:hypothetical protein
LAKRKGRRFCPDHVAQGKMAVAKPLAARRFGMVGMSMVARLQPTGAVAHRESLPAGAVVVPGPQAVGEQMTIAAAEYQKHQRGDESRERLSHHGKSMGRLAPNVKHAARASPTLKELESPQIDPAVFCLKNRLLKLQRVFTFR